MVTSHTGRSEIIACNWSLYRPLTLSVSVLLPSNCLFASFLLDLMYVLPMSSTPAPLPLPLGDASAVVRLELKAANRMALRGGALG